MCQIHIRFIFRFRFRFVSYSETFLFKVPKNYEKLRLQGKMYQDRDRFLAHLNWKLKWTFLIAHCPASICPSVCKLLHFYLISRITGPILTRLGTNHSWVKRIQVCSKEGDSPSPRGYNSGRVKIHWKFLKIFFPRTGWSKSIKLGTNYLWEKGILVFSSPEMKAQVG
jgi:hypothetical protein